MSEKEAYLCGLLCAAGRVEINERVGNYYISLGTSRWEMMKLFSNVLGDCLGKPRIYTTIKDSEKESRISYRVVKYGKDAVEGFVSRWGLSAGTGSWKIPDICMENEPLGAAFLRGFFDCEGVVTSYVKKTEKGKHKIRRVRCTSSNSKGLEEIRNLLRRLGIRSSSYQSGRYFCLDIEGKTRLELFKSRVGFNILYKRKLLGEALEPLSAM